MTGDELAQLLNDKGKSFFSKLKHAWLNDSEYWEGGHRPENLPREMLDRYLRGLDVAREFIPKMELRKSVAGKYCKTGFTWVFAYEDSFVVAGVGLNIYLKGFFFEIDSPRGVEIQSFKISKPKLKSVT